MKEDVSIYFIRQVKAFERNFKKAHKGFDMKAIHQMRLSVKRTKALFQFLEAVDTGKFKAKEEFRSIKTLFKLSGKIRDVQVHRALVRKSEEILQMQFPKYDAYLEQLEEDAIGHFNENFLEMHSAGDLLNNEKVRSSISRLSRKRKLHLSTIRLLNSKIKAIDQLRKDLSTDENVHRIRIILKQIHYIFDFSNQGFNYKLFLKMPMNRLKKIEAIFGKWHDYVNAVIFITNYMEHAEMEEAENCRPLLRKVEMQKKVLFDQIRTIVGHELLFQYVLEI